MASTKGVERTKIINITPSIYSCNGLDVTNIINVTHILTLEIRCKFSGLSEEICDETLTKRKLQYILKDSAEEEIYFLSSNMDVTTPSIKLTQCQHKWIKMRAELANLNDCAVLFLSRATANLSRYNSRVSLTQICK